MADLPPRFRTPCAAAGVPEPSLCRDCGIRDLAICGALKDSELGLLDRLVTHVSLIAGDTLFEEEETPRFVYNVATGTLRISKLLPDGRRQITGFMFPGDFLGVASSQAYTCTAEAVTEAAVCRFNAKELGALCDAHPGLERRLLGKARDELVAAQDHILLLGRKTPAERIATFLLMLSRRAESWGMPGDPVVLPMARSDIADYLGLTVETVSRTFTRLKSKGTVALPESNRVFLKDLATLRELAGEG